MTETIPTSGAELFTDRRVSWAFSTRIAIRAAVDLLDLKPGDEVLAPAYNCGSELDPLLQAGLAVTLYPIGRDLVACADEIATRITPATKAVYVTHYFGWLQPEMQAIRALCDGHGLKLMEDCALSLFSGDRPAEGRWGDVAFFCAYKYLPVLGGGAMVINDQALPDPPAFSAPIPRKAELKFAARGAVGATGGLELLRGLKRRLKGAPDHVASYAEGSTDQDIPASYYYDDALTGRAVSTATLRALYQVDPAQIISLRRTNWLALRDMVADLKGVELLLTDLPDGVCPLSLPVLISDRDRVTAALQAQGEDVTPWWAGFHRGLDWRDAGAAVRLKTAALALPVGQGVSPRALERSAARLQAALSQRAS